MADHIQFVRDVRDHKMTIELDHGVHRSIRFGSPGSSAYYFRLNTWPGSLSISGDCGSYVFSRISDMFDFFRDASMTGRINPEYWYQKAEAVDRNGGAKRYSQDRLSKAVRNDAAEWQVRLGDATKILSEVEGLASEPFGNEHEAYQAVRDFEASDGNSFYDFDYDLTDWDYGYLWNLRAIVWGIHQYDLHHQGRTQKDHDALVLAGVL